MILVTFVALLAIIGTSIYVYLKRIQTYWERRGVFQYHPQQKGENVLLESYKRIKALGIKHGGFVRAYRPSFITVDLDTIKAILIKDADHFLNRGMYINPKEVAKASILRLENEQWKSLRSIVSPIFSSGKLKMIFPSLTEHAKIMVQVLNDYVEEKKAVEARDIVKRFGMDSMGSCTFGLEINTLLGKNEDFQSLVRDLLKIDWKRIVANVVDRKILNFVGFSTSHPKIEEYVRNLINGAEEYREKNNIQRNDIFQYVKQITDSSIEDGQLIRNRKLSRQQMITQLNTFFVGGFETSSITAAFALLEIASNPDVQKKLRKNIRENLKQHGELTYDALMDMDYLDCVINETLRKFPPAPNTSRICNKPYKIPNSDIVIQREEFVTVPIYALHTDPEYYPEPDKFDPERFSPENKAKRHPMTFLPFGGGPRNCIGSRLGLIIAKVAVVSIINNFNATVNDKTIRPLRFKRALVLDVEGGIWLNLSKTDA